MSSTNNYTPTPHNQVDTWPYLNTNNTNSSDPDAIIGDLYEGIEADIAANGGHRPSHEVLLVAQGSLSQGQLSSRETTMNIYPPSPQEVPAESELDPAHRAYQDAVLAAEPGNATVPANDQLQTGPAYSQQLAELYVGAKLAAINTQASGFEDLLDGVSGDAYRVPPSQEVREFAQSQQSQQITGAADRFSRQPLNNLADLESRVSQAEGLCKTVLVIMKLVCAARNEALASGAPRSDHRLPEEYMSK